MRIFFIHNCSELQNADFENFALVQLPKQFGFEIMPWSFKELAH
jgi:hypothetical protein